MIQYEGGLGSSITGNQWGLGWAISATVTPSHAGSGYADGPQVLTLNVGSNCTVAPQFNVTASGGAITAVNSVAVQGSCIALNCCSFNVPTTGGSGSGAELQVTYYNQLQDFWLQSARDGYAATSYAQEFAAWGSLGGVYPSQFVDFGAENDAGLFNRLRYIGDQSQSWDEIVNFNRK